MSDSKLSRATGATALIVINGCWGGFARSAKPPSFGLRDHDRRALARTGLHQRLVGRRKNSKLPQLVDLVMRRPIASAALIAAELGVTPRAAQNLVRELGLREATGRGRYRAWGIL